MARKTTKSKGTRRSTMNKRRKGFLSVALPFMRRFGLVLGAVIGIVWLGAWMYVSGAAGNIGEWSRSKMIGISGDAGFRVANILVEGRQHSDSDVILALVNMRRGDPIFAFSPHEAKDQLEKISWVADAHVERRLPGTIYIRITERKPAALWKDGGLVRLLDDQGHIIASENLVRFKELMMVEGDKAPERLSDLAMYLAERPDLMPRIERAQMISGRRWDLHLRGGIVVKLPEIGIAKALERLETAHVAGGLLDKDIESIDMREPDRMAVRVKSGQVQTYAAGADASAEGQANGNNI